MSREGFYLKNFHMYMENGERVEYSSQNFDFYFQILENALLNGFECRVSPFFHVRP